MKTLRLVRRSNPAVLPGAVGLALIAGMAFAAPAAAQEQTADQLDKMEQEIAPPPVIDTDADNDIDIDAEEADAPPSEVRDDFRWDQLDADGDGQISRSEGSADPDFDSNFEMVDADSDGYVDDTELDEDDPVDQPEPEEEDDSQ